jgi:hypothetical protein
MQKAILDEIFKTMNESLDEKIEAEKTMLEHKVNELKKKMAGEDTENKKIIILKQLLDTIENILAEEEQQNE